MWRGQHARWLAAWLAAATLLLVLLAVAVTRWSGWDPDPGHRGAWLSQLAGAVVFGYVGAAISDRTAGPAVRVGLLLQVTGLSQAGGLLTSSYLQRASAEGWGGTSLARWLDGWIWAPGVLAVVTVLPLVYPEGRPLPALAWLARTGAGLTALGTLFIAWAAWPGHALGWLDPLVAAIAAVCAIGGLASLVQRHRRGDRRTREQVRWLLGSVVLLLAFEPLAGVLPGPLATAGLSVLALLPPAAIGVAVLRHGLYDIDLAVTRALTYVVLCAVLAAIYVGVVVLAGRQLAGRQMAGASLATPALVAAITVALLADPLRRWLQDHLSRWLRGATAEPHRLLADLAERLGSSHSVRDAPQTAVDVLAEAFRADFVELSIRDGGGTVLVARAGAGTGGAVTRMPVSYAGRTTGEIAIARGEPLAGHEQRALAGVPAAIGPVLDGWQLAHELQRSRAAIVEAREAERTRLHRDLHDGLGPTLGGITLGLDAARNLVHQDVGEAERILGRLSELAGQATGEVRSLVEALRPAALDARGLEELIRCHAEAAEPPLTVSVDAALAGALSPAVEVATLRIVLEAVTNVRRHAAATSGRIRLALGGDGMLTVVVDDDGQGILRPRPAGVGLASIRARAAELGGVATVGRSPMGGTRVLARIPVDGGAHER